MKSGVLGTILVLALFSMGAGACASADPPSLPDGEGAVAEDDLVTGRVTTIRVTRTTGEVLPAPAGQCRRAGTWSYDFQTRALTGSACIASKPVTVDEVLSEDDGLRVRTALSKVRTAKRPSSCPTDMPVASLEVHRAKSSASYVDSGASCETSATPVREATLDGLVTLLEELSVPAAESAPCVRTGCSGTICADEEERFSRCLWQPTYACYQAAICERGSNGECGFRHTTELASCLASARTNGSR